MRFRRVAACLLLAASSATACGGSGEDDFAMGISRIALSLAFADEELAEPIEPERIVQYIDVVPPAVRPVVMPAPTIPPPVTPVSLLPECPVAPEEAGTLDVVSYGIKRPPPPGTYLRHNEGKLVITTTLSVSLPFPPLSTMVVEGGEEIAPPEFAEDPLAPLAGFDNGGDRLPGEDEGAPFYEYRVERRLTPDFVIVDHLRLTSRRLLLLQRDTITPETSETFVPRPAVTLLEHAEGEGHTWRSAGIDTETGQGMTIDGAVEAREPVDVCGVKYDSYRVVVNEQMVNLATGATSGTSEDDPNVYNVATQHGGLVLAEDLHFTQTVADAGGAVVLIEWDYRSVNNSVEPQPEVGR